MTWCLQFFIFGCRFINLALRTHVGPIARAADSDAEASATVTLKASIGHELMRTTLASKPTGWVCYADGVQRKWGAGFVYRWKEHIRLYGSHLFWYGVKGTMSTLMQSFLAALTLQLPDYFCCPFFVFFVFSFLNLSFRNKIPPWRLFSLEYGYPLLIIWRKLSGCRHDRI